ncbi:MurR/RpiR family transcriptional regulator [Numidum massiliense]|uniref:MurR/RpiR family transcriptional regulator n=1 Tax=Numidum massiliense TaxID=1522315 RepID=UPI0006D55D2A|nr:MurR/RpiR family transcriptional regulator [Numidum massiliense]
MKLINNQMPHFSSAERNVAQYVADHLSDVVNMTTKQLAAACNSSEASVIRFCKRIGINSFKGLKIEIAKGLHQEHTRAAIVDSPFDFNDDMRTVVDKATARSIDSLNHTRKILSLEALDAAVQAFHQANRIYLYGAAGSSIVVQDLAQKLLRINCHAFQSNDFHVQMMMAANMDDEDVLFLVSTSGETKEILQLLTTAKETGTKTVLLTQLGKSTAASQADIVLNISAEEHDIRIGTMSARIAELAVIDMLFIGLCIEKGDQVFQRIVNTHHAVKKIKHLQEEN